MPPFSLFTLQIVKALEHLHSKLSVIHRGNQKITSSPYTVFSFLVMFLIVCRVLSLSSCSSPDVKPSNVLINTLGQVKMCDFGISGHLVDSVAKTMDAGCKPYMAVSADSWYQLAEVQERVLQRFTEGLNLSVSQVFGSLISWSKTRNVHNHLEL